MFTRMKEYWQDLKAWRRGERRIAPYGTRGRVYAQTSVSPSSVMDVETKMSYKIMARVIRANGQPDEHYNLTEGMKLSSDDFNTLRGDMNHG